MSHMRPTKRRRVNGHEQDRRRRFRRVVLRPDPFGFPLGPHLGNVCAPVGLGDRTHSIQNYITGFEQGQPIFHIPDHEYRVESVDGMYAKLVGRSDPRMIATLHTSYTVRLYHEAHSILSAIKEQNRVQLVNVAADDFKTVDISRATFNRRQNVKNVVYLNAKHLDKTVVLKTTTDPSTMLKYVLEAVIHYHLKLKAPGCVPDLHFIGMADKNRLVVCSEQLTIPSVATWVNTLRRRDNSRALYFMLKNVCNAFAVIQRNAKFTHRDCHTANVYYNERTRQIQFIDFDWSCIRVGDKTISVPRFLYDTTRSSYGKNRSVDLCIFMRCLGHQIKQAPGFLNTIWLPLMRRYERESGALLLQKYAGYDGVSGESAAKQLYKMGIETVDGRRKKYSHTVGYKTHKKEFDYIMGYYEYPCMTPGAILKFLREHDITRR